MCHMLAFATISTACVETPKHVSHFKTYFVCDNVEIKESGDPKDHCDDENCISLGQLGSTRGGGGCRSCAYGDGEPYEMLMDSPYLYLVGCIFAEEDASFDDDDDDTLVEDFETPVDDVTGPVEGV